MKLYFIVLLISFVLTAVIKKEFNFIFQFLPSSLCVLLSIELPLTSVFFRVGWSDLMFMDTINDNVLRT